MTSRSKNILSFCLMLSSLLIFTNCTKKTDDTKSQLHQEYFDLTPGKFIEYQVREITHNSNSTIQHDTLNYFLRIQIEDTIYDNQGRLNRKYVRYKRNSEIDNWVVSDVWMAFKDNINAELTEENEKIIKLKFPVNSYTNWNANIFNSSSPLDCFYEQIHSPRTINGLFFDSTVVVNQGSDRNLIRFYKKQEVYAKGIGMVNKYFKDLNISNFDTLNITSGKEIFMEIINFGN
jgi:hypothetical protein